MVSDCVDYMSTTFSSLKNQSIHLKIDFQSEFMKFLVAASLAGPGGVAASIHDRLSAMFEQAKVDRQNELDEMDLYLQTQINASFKAQSSTMKQLQAAVTANEAKVKTYEEKVRYVALYFICFQSL